MNNVSIRPITKQDNPIIAQIIKSSLEEFGANQPGTAYYDENTNYIYESFTACNHPYFIATLDDKVIGGVGLYPTEGLPSDTCELSKMYITKEARGLGIASLLIEKCKATALDLGYKNIYLSSMPELSTALKIYEKKGWHYLCKPIGNSPHTGCSLYMLLQLPQENEEVVKE
jgi:putative acetyltransferase